MCFYSTQQLLKQSFNKVIDYLGAVLSLSAKTVIIVALICKIVNSFCTLFCKINRFSAIFYLCLCLFYRGDSAYCYFLKKCYKMGDFLVF